MPKDHDGDYDDAAADDDDVHDDDVPDDGGHDDHGYEAHRNEQKHASACQGTGQMPQLGHQACLTRVPVPLYCCTYAEILQYYNTISTISYIIIYKPPEMPHSCPILLYCYIHTIPTISCTI